MCQTVGEVANPTVLAKAIFPLDRKKGSLYVNGSAGLLQSVLLDQSDRAVR